jgi:hypothetical protein
MRPHLPRAPVVNVSRVDLSLFVVLDAVDTEGGITRASSRLNLDRPEVGHALARLRELNDRYLYGHANADAEPGSHWLRAQISAGLHEPERETR